MPYIIMSLLILGFNSIINDEKSAAFDLRKDLTHFSYSMNESDSMIIVANLSACSSRWHETNILTKKNNQILISTSAKGDFVEDDEKQLKSTFYHFAQNDSLNFENLFSYMEKKNVQGKKTKSNVFTIIFKQDTVTFYSYGLNDHLNNINYYIKIKRRIYPSVKMYQPLEIPPKPDEQKE
ncbi:hypothetical protein [Prolixibacter denitrificans]|uniref:Uncharacterized protein n=2 Tax=Prolixibacter denitrificans TaxID=1541063 RepID=A0A2P8CFJ6_9BACT|nr:hypothetical protein [Prolixibacter denitrificans]PSK83755.1 hypothetical protein CLV93_103170 [Prolixibacter denitrificans]